MARTPQNIATLHSLNFQSCASPEFVGSPIDLININITFAEVENSKMPATVLRIFSML